MRSLVLLALVGLAVCLPADESIKPSRVCNPGYTGTMCQNPICDDGIDIIDNHGPGDGGDMIFWDKSARCDEEFAFYVDQYVQNITLFVRGGSGFQAKVFRNDTEVIPAGPAPVVPVGTSVTQYDFIANFYGYGRYRLLVMSDATQSCEIWITSPTPLMIDGGFVQDQRDDNVQYVVPEPNQGVARNPIKGNSSYFAFQFPKALTHPAQPTMAYAYVMGSYGTSGGVRDRYNCDASYIAGPFECDPDATDPYHIKISGVDRKGNSWERVYPYMCESGPVSTPKPSPPTECRNDGVFINTTEVQECYCGPYYEGTMCEIKRCLNNGKVDELDHCNCDSGFTGEHCQHVVCDKKAEGYEDFNQRSITFVVRTGLSMNAHIPAIANAAVRIYNYYQNTNATYIQQWVLVTLTNGVVDVQNTQNFDAFKQAILGLPASAEETPCEDNVLTAVSEAINNFAVATYKRSLIFVFSDGMPKDFEAGQTLWHQLSFFRGQIFFMLADSATKRCEIEPSHEGYRAMRWLAMFSHGQVSYIPLSELEMATYILAVTAHKADHIMTNDLMDSCQSAPEYMTFFVDPNMRSVFISATGTGLSIKLVTPARKEIVPAEFFYHRTTGNLYVWNILELLQGGYLMKLTSTSHDPCSVRVFGFGDTSLWVGITNSKTEDAVVQQPVYMEKSHLVAKINNVQYGDPNEINAEMTVWTNEGYQDRRTVLYASRGIYRDNCAFNLYFGDFKCVYPNTMYYVNVYVTNNNGYLIQRSYTGFCSITPATETPPEGCQNGGYPITLDDGNRTCLCPAHYTGPKCQNIQCMNVGTPVGASCECIKGFTGQFCEISSCMQLNKERDFSPNGRSLTLVIQDSIQTRTSIRNIKSHMPSLIQDLTHQHKEWITSYEIWRFNDTTFTKVISTTDPNGFLQGISILNDSNSAASDPSCANLMVLPGLLRVMFSAGLTYEGIIYFYIAGYMKVDFQHLNEVEAVYEMLESSRVMFNVVQMSGSPCGTELSSPQSTILMNFAAFTGGQYIMVMPGNAGVSIRAIPTFYRNNYIYDNFIHNCTTQQSIYFPVDSQMQSVTVSLAGELDESSIAYYDPSGSRKYPFNIWSDSGMGSRMDQLIRECDPDWALHGVRCWKIELEPKSWTDARETCRANDAVIITILNKAEQDYADYQFNGVEYWIGLNNRASRDAFVWDTIDNQTLSLDNTGFKNWGAGQPEINDDKRCVYDKKGLGWTVDDCNAKRYFLCVKHAYDADYEPDFHNLGDLLPRGIWKATFKTTDGACNIQIYGQSGIQLYTQFTTNVHSDFGTEQPLQKADDNRAIAHTTNQNPIGQGVAGVLQYSHYYFYNMSIVQAQTYAMRDTKKCNYEYISTGFRCPSNNFLSLTTGVDRFGYLYQRIDPVSCFKGPRENECQNNATFYNGKCYCLPNYEGDFCERPICQRGTLNSAKKRCVCPPGYAGIACEIPVCNRGGANQATVPSYSNRTLIFVLDGSQNDRMSIVAAEWNATLTAVLKKAQAVGYQGWFTHFTGVVFRDGTSTAPVSNLIESDDSTDFINRMLTELQTPYTPTSTTRYTISAIAKALNSPFVQPRSFAWVVTGSNPEDYTILQRALDNAAKNHVYVHFLIVGDDKAPGGVQYNDTSLDAYYQLITQTSGQMYQVANDVAGTLSKFWVALFAGYYRAFFITNQNLWDCSRGLVEYVQMSTNGTVLIVDAVGGGIVNIWAANGTKVNALTVVSSKTNKVYVYALEDAEPGLWKVQMPKNPGFCRVEVRIQSNIDVFVGYVHDGEDNGLHSRDVDYRPLSDGVNSVVAHTDAGKINFVQMFSADERTLLWASPMIFRQQCAYEYVSSREFICTAQSVSVAVEGEDDFGYPFRRMIHTHCIGNYKPTPTPITNMSTNAPLTTPPLTTLVPLTCSPDAAYDVMLVFDGSATVEVNDFIDIVKAFMDVPNKMTIDSNHMQFKFGTYSETVFWIPPDENMVNNTATFQQWLDFTSSHGYDGMAGNNIDHIFSDMNNHNWFRPLTSQVLLLFSSVGWDREVGGDGKPLFPDPRPAAQAFRRAGGKILAIGYGPLADEAMLRNLGDGCDRMAANRDAALAMVPWIISAICSNQPYCAPATR